MKLTWTILALEEFIVQIKHIQAENPIASRNRAELIEQSEKTAQFPRIGRPGHRARTRELVVPPYVIIYRASDKVIEVLNCYHGAQQRWR